MAVFFYGSLPRPPFSRRAYSTCKRERTVAVATVRHPARNVSSFYCQFPARSGIGRGLPALAPALDCPTVRAEGGFLQRSFLLPRRSVISKLRSLALYSARSRSPFLLFLSLSSVVSLRLSFTRGEGRGRSRVEFPIFTHSTVPKRVPRRFFLFPRRFRWRLLIALFQRRSRHLGDFFGHCRRRFSFFPLFY